jgi:hypothetical protein
VNQPEISITASELLAMSHPEAEISAEQLKRLERLVDSVPWFSYGQLVLLKGMKQHQHPAFDARLLTASLYATSRERLHDYLKQIKIADRRKPNARAAEARLDSSSNASANSGNLNANNANLNGVNANLNGGNANANGGNGNANGVDGNGGDSDDGFEVMPFDTVCEKVVEMPPAHLPEALRRQNAAAYHDQLIDMFLATQPTSIKPRPDVNDSNLAQHSERDTPHDLVSETLAEIYLAQGLPDKAEQIYSKLSLLYPEKKAYFAARFQSQCAGVPSESNF